LVRGDSGDGNEGILTDLESRGQRYLLRLRQTKNVQRLVAQQFARDDRSRPGNQGCQMAHAQLQLHGWSPSRAARCCWPQWARPPAMPTRPRCTSRRCTAGSTCPNG
jgi:hypothetical protein